jgi:hypothetical protein
MAGAERGRKMTSRTPRPTVTVLLAVSFFFAGAALPSENSSSAGQPSTWSRWTSGTAYTMPDGRWELGVFQSLRYGLSETVEGSTHPLAFFLIPNLDVKWAHGSKNGFRFSTRHSLTYPTLLLRLVSRKGIGGLISPEFDIPHMVSVYNDVIVSKPVWDEALATAYFGFSFSVKSGSLDERTTIDLPLVFHRLNVFYGGTSFRCGAGLKMRILRRWRIQADGDGFWTPRVDEHFAFEHKGLLLWTKSETFQFCLGYKLTFGQYPFGMQWHLFVPLVDCVWGWGGKPSGG